MYTYMYICSTVRSNPSLQTLKLIEDISFKILVYELVKKNKPTKKQQHQLPYIGRGFFKSDYHPIAFSHCSAIIVERITNAYKFFLFFFKIKFHDFNSFCPLGRKLTKAIKFIFTINNVVQARKLKQFIENNQTTDIQQSMTYNQ